MLMFSLNNKSNWASLQGASQNSQPFLTYNTFKLPLLVGKVSAIKQRAKYTEGFIQILASIARNTMTTRIEFPLCKKSETTVEGVIGVLVGQTKLFCLSKRRY